jgi:hypothetical protein
LQKQSGMAKIPASGPLVLPIWTLSKKVKFMASSTEKVKVNIHEKDFEVEIIEKQGKVFAKTHLNNFGEIQVPDFGGGKDKALANIQARIGNIITAMQLDEARETRRKQWEEEQAKKQQSSNN